MTIHCKNCGADVAATYCGHCGQHRGVDRISGSVLLAELKDNILQIDRGFLYTVQVLFRSPGMTIRGYLQGKRKTIFKPIAYLLVCSTVYFVLTQIIGQTTWMDDIVTGISLGSNVKGDDGVPMVLLWFSRNFAYATLLLLPVFSLATRLCFKKWRYNFFEHVVLNSFIFGQHALIYSVFSIIKILTDIEIMEILPVIFAFIFALWVLWQFFNTGNRIVVLLLSVLAHIIYLIFSLALLFIALSTSEF